MDPDLGLQYVQDGFARGVAILFYDVEFHEIAFVSQDVCSAMFNYPYKGQVYAISFDFSRPILDYLLTNIPSWQRDVFIASIHGRKLPFQTILPVPITAKVVECRLGETIQVQKEQFVPFVISRVE